MKSKVFSTMINEKNMQDFIHQVMDIFRISNYHKYIIFSLKIEEEDCVIRMSILNYDGVNQQYEDVHMDASSSYFPSFLMNLVQAFREHCEIIKEDIVNLDQDEYVAFRMITEYNDFVTFDGLTEEMAQTLLKK